MTVRPPTMPPKPTARRLAAILAIAGSLVLVACGTADVLGAPSETAATAAPEAPPTTTEAVAEGPPPHVDPEVVDTRPPPMHQPVPLFDQGHSERQVDAATARHDGYMVIDLGEEWTPYLFTERDGESEEALPNSYRRTYLALARGELPDDHHGDRAREDKYLELYGIMPTIGLLRTRFQHTRDLECAQHLDLEPLRTFEGFVTYESREEGRNFSRRFRNLETQMRAIAHAQGVEGIDQIDATRIRSERDRRQLGEYQRLAPRALAVRAAQARLECEGYFEGKGEHVEGGLDWPTHEALAEFERRHRIYGWGFLGRETLDMLRRSPMEGDQEAVIRVLTERAMHAAGVIEDGSVSGSYRGSDGVEHEVPNLEGQIRSIVVESFGLQTPESTLAFLEGLGELGADQAHSVAIPMPELPEYYTADMDLSVEIDRGDVWYEFPYDEQGAERAQPVERRPHLTISTTWSGQRIALARFGTTIGGWRSEHIDGRLWWRYKNSPPGPVVWHQIVAAPVWLPPESTPPRDLFRRTGRRGRDAYRPNYHETGPSYASAYGLVAAYHIGYRERDDGSLRLGGDDGIRTHGSVDYMSIMRRHSHGCHRLHNHIAVRLMSFVLEHRAHTRVGQQAVAFRRDVEIDGNNYSMEINQGGYVYQLAEPIHVEVLEGRIRGDRATPIDEPLPRFDTTVGAYMLPDGGAVSISRMGQMTAIPVPTAVGDAGVPAAR
ncbi:MAG: hypothetical protein K1X94_06950 [Sandaracinaceae bacterium]|nr:hypothetical protein [Sandaracinaceae bacterium]